MPSSMTHNYFCKDVYDKLDISIQNKLKDSILKFYTFGQGPDPYFFYDFHLSKRAKKVFEINKLMQHSKVNEYFLTLINYINDKGCYDKPEVLAYLYGHICHFTLDSIAHPFIIYNTGMYDSKDKTTYKYNGLHEEMEYYIDNYLINKRERIRPKNFKVYDKIFDVTPFYKETIDVIDYTVDHVYGYKNAGNLYYKSIRDMKKFYYVFNYDKYGFKKIAYRMLDLVCGNRVVKKMELSFHINPNNKIYYLNMQKNEWNHPCELNEKYDLSFPEIYVKAINRAVIIIGEINKMFDKKRINSTKIKELFGNIDYGTGKDCDKNYQFKFFKF